MTRPTKKATSQPHRRSRRLLAGVSIALGLAVLIPEGSSAILASERPVFSQLVESDGVKPARRVSPAKATQTAPPPPAPTAPPAAPLSAVSTNERFAREVVDRTNAERAAVGVAPLTAIPKLALAASFHVEDQRNKVCQSGILTHTGTDGSRGVDRILRTGLDISRWGENIACGHSTPEAVVKGWMDSPGHRANILDPNLTHIGVAVGVSDITNYFYWVQNFAALR